MQINVLDYLFNIVKSKSEKIAFCDGESSLSFGEIRDVTESIGSFLNDKGIYRCPVIIFMKRHPRVIAAFCGVIAGGNYYVPIDPGMPVDRIQLILDSVSSPIMICDENTLDTARKLLFSGQIVEYQDICKHKVNPVALNNIYERVVDTDSIYIVFTSGSTGVPKGVAACHRSVIDYVEQLSETLGFDEDTVFGSQTPLYVDACLKEIFPTLKYGATTYLIPKELFKYPVKLVEYLNRYRINTICWVVSALVIISSLNTFKTIRPEYLRLIAFGSESFPIKQFNRWKQAVPEAEYFNLYGPTEATGMSCYYKVDRDFNEGDVIPIGKPFRNTRIMLLDDSGCEVKKGEQGEICIGGTCITLGYYNNPKATAEAFIQNPLNPYYPETIYKTGDLGRINEEGLLEFISRKDYQIKHMGYRIELGEIEANASSIEKIEMTGCIYDDKKSKIVLFYTGNVQKENVTYALSNKLPEYMLPQVLIQIDKMPLTPNGKLDRRALKEIYCK